MRVHTLGPTRGGTRRGGHCPGGGGTSRDSIVSWRVATVLAAAGVEKVGGEEPIAAGRVATDVAPQWIVVEVAPEWVGGRGTHAADSCQGRGTSGAIQQVREAEKGLNTKLWMIVSPFSEASQRSRRLNETRKVP